MRSVLRWFALYVAAGLILAIGFGVISEFFIELAREKGWYTNPSDKLDTAMSAFSSFVTQTWFLIITAALGGLAIGVWLDVFLRRSAAPPATADTGVLSKLENMGDSQDDGDAVQKLNSHHSMMNCLPSFSHI